MKMNKQELELQITTLIKQHVPEGTSDQEIEIMKAAVTAAIVRGLGAAGRGLKNLIGRVIQFFRGKRGVWVTQNGRKVFVPIDRAAKGTTVTAAGISPGAARKLKRASNKGNALQRRWNKGFKNEAAKEAFADDVISALRDALG